MPEKKVSNKTSSCNCASAQTVVKAKPLFKIVIAGNALVLTSDMSFDTIQKLEQTNPNALRIMDTVDSESVESFKISTGAVSSISKYGITFAEQNEEGLAQATILLPTATTDKKNYVLTAFSTTFNNLDNLTKAIINECPICNSFYSDAIKEIK